MSAKAFITTTVKNPTELIYKLQVSTSSNFSSIITSISETIDTYNFIKYEIDNLNFNTQYYVRLVTQNNVPINNYVGSFKTPIDGPHNFNFAFGSCSRSCPPNCDAENPNPSASNSVLYTRLRDKALNNSIQFFVHLGDMHYRDIDTDNEELFHNAFNDVFDAPNQNSCWKELPMYYMWDDHDYGPNDTDINNPARPAAISAFNARVPRPPSPSGASAPYYSFIRGRVRFIMTDIRSERQPKNVRLSTDRLKKIFSDAQKRWFFNQMLQAKQNNQIIIWANTKPWISSIEDTKDDWGGYHAARIEIVQFIVENDLFDGLLIISGDMHALAYDDGTSVNNYGRLKVCHAAPLDEQIRVKGGPYKTDALPQNSDNIWASQYGIIEITDNGSCNIGVRFKGISVGYTPPHNETTLIDQSFNLSPCYPIRPTCTPPLNKVDPNTTCYKNIITYAPECCTNWDSLCDEFYRAQGGFYTFELAGTYQAIGRQIFGSETVGGCTPPLCAVVPPEGVDISSACYKSIIQYDTFCCENEWDPLTCGEYYAGVAGFYKDSTPGVSIFGLGAPVPDCPCLHANC